MVIKYNQENDKITNKIELDHCQRIKSSVRFLSFK